MTEVIVISLWRDLSLLEKEEREIPRLRDCVIIKEKRDYPQKAQKNTKTAVAVKKI